MAGAIWKGVPVDDEVFKRLNAAQGVGGKDPDPYTGLQVPSGTNYGFENTPEGGVRAWSGDKKNMKDWIKPPQQKKALPMVERALALVSGEAQAAEPDPPFPGEEPDPPFPGEAPEPDPPFPEEPDPPFPEDAPRPVDTYGTPGALDAEFAQALSRYAAKDVAPETAEMAMEYAKWTGVNPEVTQRHPTFLKDRVNEAYTAALRGSPIVGRFAGESPTNMKAVQESASHMTALEWWLTGSPSWRQEGDSVAGQPVWMRIPNQGVAGLSAAGLSVLVSINRGMDAIFGPQKSPDDMPTPSEAAEKALGKAQAYAESSSGEATTRTRRVFEASTAAVPTIAAMVLSAPSKAASTTVIAIQNYTPLINQLKDRAGLSDGQARALAVPAAFLTGIFGTRYLPKLAGALLPSGLKTAIGESLWAATSRGLANAPNLWPNLVGRGMQAGEAVVAGFTFNMANEIGNEATIQLAKVVQGRPLDPSDLVEAGRRAASGTYHLLPLLLLPTTIGVGENLVRASARRLGSWYLAHLDGVTLSGISHAVQNSPGVTEPQMGRLLTEMSESNPDNKTVYTHPDVFDVVMRGAKRDPEAEAGRIMGDDGAAYRAAKANRTFIPFSLRALGGLMRDGLLDKLLPHTKLHEDGQTQWEASQADITPDAEVLRKATQDLKSRVESPPPVGYRLTAEEVEAALQSGLEPDEVYKILESVDPEIAKQFKQLKRDKGPSSGAPLPNWAREAMLRAGLDPNRPLNDVDLGNPTIVQAIEADPTLTREQKDRLLKTGSPDVPSLALLLARRTHILNSDMPKAEQLVKLREIEEQMRAAAAESAKKAEAYGPDRPATVEEQAEAKFAPPKPPITPPPPPKPGAKARQAAARDYANTVPIGVLDVGETMYRRSARRAQVLLDAVHRQAVNRLAEGLAKAQQGIVAGIKAAVQGRRSQSITEAANLTAQEVEWAKGLRPKPIPSGEAMPEDSVSGGLYDVGGAQEGVPEADPVKILRGQREGIRGELRESEQGQKKAESKSVEATFKEVKAGELIQLAEGHETTRDNADSMGDAYERASKRGKKIAERWDAWSSETTRNTISLSNAEGKGPEYRDFYDAVMGGLGLRDQAPVPDLDALLARLIGEGAPIAFDTGMLKEWLRNPKSLSDMTLPEAENLHEALATVRRAALDFNAVMSEGRTQSRTSWLINAERWLIRQGLQGGRYQYPISGQESIDTLRAKSNSPLLNEHGIWAPFGDLGRERSRLYRESLYRWGEAMNAHLEHMEENFFKKLGDGLMMDVLEPVDVRSHTSQMVDHIPLDRTNPQLANVARQIPRRDVYAIALQAGNKSGLAKMAAGWRVSEATITDWLNSILLKPEWEAIHTQWRHNDSLWKAWTTVRTAEDGRAPETLDPRTVQTPFGSYVGGYSPMRWFDRPLATPAPASDPYMGMREGMDTPHSFGKERVDGFKAIPDVRWDTLPGHYRAIIWDMTMSPFVRDNYLLINDPRFKTMAQNYLGENRYAQMESWQKSLANVFGVQDRATNFYTGLLKQGTSSAARAAFTFVGKIMLGQSAHVLVAIAAKGVHPVHLGIGVAKSLIPEEVAAARRLGQVLNFRTQNFESRILEQEAAVGGFQPNSLLSAIDYPARWVSHGIDTSLSNILWHTFMSHYTSEGHAPAEALARTEEAVDQVMPGMHVTQQSAFGRDRGVIASIFLTRMYSTSVFNMQEMLDWEQRARLSDAPGGGGAAKIRLAIMGRRLGIAAGIAFGHYLMGHGLTEEEQKERGPTGLLKGLLRTTAIGASYGHPLLHPLVQAFAPAFLGEGMHARNLHLLDLPFASLLDSAYNGLGKTISDNSPATKVMAAAEVAGRLTGFPPIGPLHSVQGVLKTHGYLGGLRHQRNRGLMGDVEGFLYNDSPDSNPVRDLGRLAR